MQKIRYGVLSTAQIARNAHIPVARKAADAEMVALKQAAQESKEIAVG